MFGWGGLCEAWNPASTHAWLCQRPSADVRRNLTLQGAYVIHDVPTIHLLDTVVRRHGAASVPDHAEDVAVGPTLRDVHREIDSDHAVLGSGPVTETFLAVAYLGGITSFGGAIVAGLLGPLGVVYTALHQWFELGNSYALITGIGLIVTAILNPSGIAGETRHQVAWVTSKLRP